VQYILIVIIVKVIINSFADSLFIIDDDSITII